MKRQVTQRKVKQKLDEEARKVRGILREWSGYPSEYPDAQKYPHLKQLLRNHLDMQFEDVRTLLMLPRSKTLRGGCNFAAAAVLFNIIAGSSIALYDTSEEVLTKKGIAGKRFKRLLEDFYPWVGEVLSKREFATTLWELARNPLAHTLGLDKLPSVASPYKTVELVKWPLTLARILMLEESAKRPEWTLPTIAAVSELISGGKKYALSIPALYWGIHQMLRALLASPTHALKAEDLAKKYKLEWVWHIEVL